MKLGDDLIAEIMVKTNKTINNLTGGVTKQGRLNVIPLSGKRIKFIGFPEVGEYFIFPVNKSSKINYYDYWMSIDIPSSNPDTDILGQSVQSPILKKFRVFGKFRICAIIAVNVWTNKHKVISQFVHKSLGFGGNNRMDATHFIANFPAHF